MDCILGHSDSHRGLGLDYNLLSRRVEWQESQVQELWIPVPSQPFLGTLLPSSLLCLQGPATSPSTGHVGPG
jgi:hypothetical protein